MVTKTDFHSVIELQAYTPKKSGIVSEDEVKMIRDTLELSERNMIELQNIRDMVVMLYTWWNDGERKAGGNVDYRDAMSAITSVIDAEKVRRGMEV